MEKFARRGDFCPNKVCLDYGKVQNERQRNLQKFGKTRKGVQRYRCTTCGRTFTATYGTIFYGKRISTVARVKGYKEDTILRWLREAAGHAEQVEEVLMAEFQVQRGQINALCAYMR